jgi:hypothetical protein
MSSRFLTSVSVKITRLGGLDADALSDHGLDAVFATCTRVATTAWAARGTASIKMPAAPRMSRESFVYRIGFNPWVPGKTCAVALTNSK